MEEKEKQSIETETPSEFSYLEKLAEAYKKTQSERRKADLSEEKRTYLFRMQKELAEIGQFLLRYYEKDEKKELAAFLFKNADRLVKDLACEETEESPIETKEVSPFTHALLLANRSYNLLREENCRDLYSPMILAELSALYALSAMR